MITDLRIIGWKSTGFRSPDHEMSFHKEDDSVFPITLIQMPNGTGKTTTLELLRAALSGNGSEWTKQEIIEFRNIENPSEIGEFILYTLLGDKQFTIELTVDFHNFTVAYRTTYGGSIKSGFKPPAKYRRIFSREFVELYVFDGELASRLLNPDLTKATQAIDAQFQLSILRRISKELQDNWGKHAEQVSATGERGLSRRMNRLNKLNIRLEELKNELADLIEQRNHLSLTLEHAEASYRELAVQDKSIGQELESLLEQKHKYQLDLQSLEESSLEQLRTPQCLSYNLATNLRSLKDNLDALKLPSSTSREFFDELSQAEACICGTAMTDIMRHNILERSKLYLGDDDVAVLNAIKHDIGTNVLDPAEQYKNSLNDDISSLESVARQIDDIKNEEELLLEQRQESGHSQLEEKRDEIEKIRNELTSVEDRIDILDANPIGSEDDNTDCIRALNTITKRATAEYAEATQTVSLKNNTEVLIKVINLALNYARTTLSEHLLTATNQKIDHILTRSPLRVESIDQSIVLKNQRGASMGQTLSIGYAYLASLFEMGHFSLPFIVDSPVGSLDNRVRSEIAALIPKFTNQLIAFVISSERPHFVDNIKNITGNSVQYITLFRRGSSADKLVQDDNINKCIQTINGNLIYGQYFFDSFDTTTVENLELKEISS